MAAKLRRQKVPETGSRLTVSPIPAISGPKMMQEQPILIILCGIILG